MSRQCVHGLKPLECLICVSPTQGEKTKAQKEIESLHSEIKELRAVIQNAIMSRDKWKRRARDLYVGKVVGKVEWFEEKDNE